VAVARSQSIFEVGSRDLTWVSDLTSYQVQIFTRHVKLIKKQLLKICRRCAPPFLRYRKKNAGGFSRTPPRRARVKFNRHRAKRNKTDCRSLHRNAMGRSKSTLTLGCRHTVAHYRSTPTLMMGPSRRRLSQADTLSRWVNIRNNGASNAANHSPRSYCMPVDGS